MLASNNAGFTGATTVNQGALRVRNAGPSASGPTRVLDGRPDPAPVRRRLAARRQPAAGRFGTGIFGTAILNVGGDNTWSGDITFDTLPGFSPTPSRSATW